MGLSPSPGGFETPASQNCLYSANWTVAASHTGPGRTRPVRRGSRGRPGRRWRRDDAGAANVLEYGCDSVVGLGKPMKVDPRWKWRRLLGR